MTSSEIPGPRSVAIRARSDALISRANRMTLYDIALERGEGAVLTDVDGNEYLDCLAGASANVLGHGRSDVLAAYVRQASTLQHSCFAYSPTAAVIELAEHLIATVTSNEPYKVLLGLSGSDVNGAAVEIARRHTGRRGIVKFDWAYHGTTGLSQPASGFNRLNQVIYPSSPEFIEIPFPATENHEATLRAMRRALSTGTIACVVVEPIQGDAGVRVPPPAFLRSARTLAREHGAVFVVDEVQSGMGRTGKLWCYEHYLPPDDPPDLITVGKGLAAGYAPIAAVLGRADLIDALTSGQQTLTFAGHPPSCAAAVCCLGLLRAKNGPIENAARRGEQLRTGLLPLCDGPAIEAVRGRGLMMGVVLQRRAPWGPNAFPFALALARHGVYVGVVGADQDVLRVSPPLIITSDQVGTVIEAFAAVAHEFREGTPHHYADAARKHSTGL